MSASEIEQRLQLALSASQKAADLILSHYQDANLDIETKQDDSPVTVADRGAEKILREEISRQFPDDGILGEEFDDKVGTNGFRWILDPIDGTKPFVHGVPLFGTLMGLELNDDLVMGVCRFPALDEVVYASRGQGTWWQPKGQPARRTYVKNTKTLADATFCSTTFTRWKAYDCQHVLDQMLEKCKLSRGWGDCFGYALVATGRADVMIDPVLSAWDAAAMVPILEEAGGVYLDWNGDRTIFTGKGLGTSKNLMEEVLEIVKSTG